MDPSNDKKSDNKDNDVKDKFESVFGLGRELNIKDGKLSIIPDNTKERDCLLVSGPSGSGKSTISNSYMEAYGQDFPNNTIRIFSAIAEDESIKSNNIKNLKYMKIDDHLVEKPIDPKMLSNSLCVFDDVDSLEKKYLKAIQQ